jgi:hypothetical protein
LLPETENPLDNPATPGKEAEGKKIDQEVASRIRGPAGNLFVYEPDAQLSAQDYIDGNRRLGLLRRYILVVVDDDAPPKPAYAAHITSGKWFYIDGDDEISQKNFDLVSLFLTMMAIPSAVPPISPTISVGGP